MQFTRLRLNGFKSFTDPTDLVIHRGLTGVVGPNGCGKSNLLEALRWVMGENRPTAMRGAGMEDVIFAGTDTRGARHFAEVHLQIDNTDRLAPAAFNDADQLDIVRRITRDAGSAYKINGKEARARDVQMLFADASTGAHSPALVRQGQISELINAKPKARRRILEEAAGISGLYQRRHEAELRLRATEINLERISDVIDQLAGQLAQLSRQARQAERYRQIGARLRQVEGLLLYRRWREADQARLEADAALQTSLRTSAEAEIAATHAAERRAACEDGLPALREEEAIAGAVLQRLEVQRDTLAAEEARAEEMLEALQGRIAQLAKDIERETSLNRDAQDMVTQLEWEQTQIAKAADGQDDALEEAAQIASDAAEALQDLETALARVTEDVARLAARHQSAERQISELRTSLTKAEGARTKASLTKLEAEAALADLEAALDAAQEELDATAALTEEAEATLADIEAARAQAQADEAAARGALAEAEGETATLRAEVAALARLLARERGDGTRMLDLVRVDAGYEQALGAALADDLRAPLASTGSGWVTLAPYDDAAPLAADMATLAAHVSAPDALARRLSQIGIVDAAEGGRLQAALRPGQRLVSVEGDVWRWDGLHMAASDAPSATALRLQQINRLDVLRADLAQLDARRDAMQATYDARKGRLDDLAQGERSAREARRAADQRLTEATRTLSRSESARAGAINRLDAATEQLERLQQDMADLAGVLEDAQAQQADLPELDAERARADDLRQSVEGARIAMISRRAAADELRREATARTARAQEITKSLSGWRLRLDSADTRIHDLEGRKAKAEAELTTARMAPEDMAAKRATLTDEIARASQRHTTARDALFGAENGLRMATEAERVAERAAADAREERARLEARRDAARETVTLAAARIDEVMDCAPDALLAQLNTDPDSMADASVLDEELIRLRRARDALGAVNLRAEEDAREVQTEHDTLVQEKADLEAAIAKLRSGISALNREGRERLLIAFDKVNANFTTLFTHLFSGGEARLVLVESDDPLDAGLEIMCQPPGKKLSTLSLLSGGEQTLTALALIFGVFLANPAPICVLDEVDAPLDDANVARFCDLLDEMTRRADTRYLIITHNALTMARMDRLFGVTMGERGVSQLVSVDLKQAETLVA
ncbi:condensin subunit Smc [Roseinatronobacter thiooxidans]|uniref:Chromosome partition protein Smc n=1 Tax=Roseinatronobacter thiooxidans TaxID=121821 RepID=A0A2W7QF84_9RHOB|nr:chromosome segregation protein SMC [Roseinatronobacter thiooxidans]PZX47174.1 condensin subunit Smc [Roseinatronobacter thiooxidans]